MKRLNFFIFRSFIGPFVVTFGIALFFLIMQFLWKYVDDLMGKGLQISVLLELLFYVSATLIPLALPLAVLFSSIMTFGNLAENNELTALKSSGMSLFKVMRPMLVIISIAAFFFSNYILPIANLKYRTIIFNIQEKKPTFALTEGIFYNDIEGYSIRADHKVDRTGELRGLLIYENVTVGGKIIRAKRGEMLKSENDRYLLLRLEEGAMYEEVGPDNFQKARFPYRKSFFKEAIMKFDMSDFNMPEEDEDLFKRDYDMMNFMQLDYAIDSLYVLQDSVVGQFTKNVEKSLTILNPNLYKKDSTKQRSDTLADLNNDRSKVKIIDTLIHLDSLHGSELQQAQTAAQTSIRNTKEGLIYPQTLYADARQSNFVDYKASWHKKFTLSFAIIVLFFIGAPLGAIIKKGGLGAPLVFATLFFILYYILTISGENMVETEYISPLAGIWLSSIILTPLGIWLTYKAANDSALFDWDAYRRIFSNLSRKNHGSDEDSTTLQ